MLGGNHAAIPKCIESTVVYLKLTQGCMQLHLNKKERLLLAWSAYVHALLFSQ